MIIFKGVMDMPFNKQTIAILLTTFIAYLLIVEIEIIAMNILFNLIIRFLYYTWLVLYFLYKLNPNRIYSVAIVVFALFLIYTIGGAMVGMDITMLVIYSSLSFVWFIITLLMALTFRRLHFHNQLKKYKNKE